MIRRINVWTRAISLIGLEGMRNCSTEEKRSECGCYYGPTAYYELQQDLNNIREHHFRQNGGFNHNTEKLMEQYFVTESFLNENSIIFDRYEEYGALVSQYMEGLFAS